MIYRFVILGVMALLIGACIPTSVHPLYQDSDSAFDSRLLGVWAGPDEESDTLIFRRDDERTYIMIHCQAESGGEHAARSSFEARMVKLDDNLFLDIFPTEPDIEDEFYKIHLVPTHSFMRIAIGNGVLDMGLMSYELLKDAIENNKLDIRYEQRDDLYILTDSTPKLREWVSLNALEAFPFEADFRLNKIK